MPECHNCRFNLKKSRRCIKCKGPANTQHHGKTHYRFNLDEHEGDLTKYLNTKQSDKESKLADFFRRWLSFPKKKQSLIADLITHPFRINSVLARKYKISRQAMSIKVRNLIADLPELKTLMKSSSQHKSD